MVTSVKNLVKCVRLWNFLVVFINSFFTFVIILVMLKSIIFLFDLLFAIVSSWDLNQIWSLFVVHHWNLDVCFWVSYRAVPNWLSIYLKKDSLVAQNSCCCCCFFSSQEAWNSLIKYFVTDSVFSFPQVEKKKNKRDWYILQLAVLLSSVLNIFFLEKKFALKNANKWSWVDYPGNLFLPMRQFGFVWDFERAASCEKPYNYLAIFNCYLLGIKSTSPLLHGS